MMLGLTTPDAGQVRLFGGRPIAAIQAGRVGAMLQSGALLPDVTVRELMATFAALHRRPLPVGEAMSRAGITDIAATKTTRLSGGQAQRVRYALALVPDPDLMVLDEPTVAMDVEVRRAFWASMREFTESGRTVLFATHYLEEADNFADRVVVMAAGKVVADGTGAQIKATVTGGPSRRSSPGGTRDSGGDPGCHPDRTAGRPAAPALQRFRRRVAAAADRRPADARHRDQRRKPRGRLPGVDRRCNGRSDRTIQPARFSPA